MTDLDPNEEKYLDIIRRIDPETYLIWLALQETGVNPNLIPKVIRAVSNLHLGTGYGRIQIFMTNGQITQIKTEESDQLNQTAIIDGQ